MSHFYFAWVTSADRTFSAAFERDDEQVFGFSLTHSEGDFAALDIEVRNPHIGLLGVARNVWCWLSYDNGTVVTPLFYGRLIGIPKKIASDLVNLTFVARPVDFAGQKEALAAAMRVLPYYDPLWITQEARTKPDTVLEARAELWHTDRLTHLLTSSSVISGEDGTIDLAGDFFYDSLDVSYSAPAGRRVKVEATAAWKQAAAGTIDLSQRLVNEFAAAGTGRWGMISSYTGDGLASDWPKAGTSIGSGWSVGASYALRTDGTVISEENQLVPTVADGDTTFPLWRFFAVFQVAYSVSRDKSEKLSFELEADVQALLVEPGDEEVIVLTLSTQDTDQPIEPGGGSPIGDPSRRAYFTSERGHRSVEYLIALARSKLLMRARAIDIKLETSFDNGLALTCRKNVAIADPRLPGGAAVGKVTAYELRVDGDSGETLCGITLGAAIGNGGSVSDSLGVPDYAEDTYVERGYQTYSGGSYSPFLGDVTYGYFDTIAPVDDGVDFATLNMWSAVRSLVVTNGENAQRNMLTSGVWADLQAAMNGVNGIYTRICLDLVPLEAGPFQTPYPISVSLLHIPKHIDLAAT